MAAGQVQSVDTVHLTSLPSDSPAAQLAQVIWEREPALVAFARGHWRWREHVENDREILELLARKFVPGTVPFDPDRAWRFALPPTNPSSRTCEVALYPLPFSVAPPPEGSVDAASPAYLFLFYAIDGARDGVTRSDRERAYYRVTETLDALQQEMEAQTADRAVRPIDVPMVGWMRATLFSSNRNACALISA